MWSFVDRKKQQFFKSFKKKPSMNLKKITSILCTHMTSVTEHHLSLRNFFQASVIK